MRGTLVTLSECRADSAGGPCHFIEFFSRKQRRVVRSTFSAELNSAADAYEVGRMITWTYAAIWSPQMSMKDIQLAESHGKLCLQIHLFIDCLSILESLKQEVIRTPSEATLILLLHSLKEALTSGHLRWLSWCDTVDMLADGLNKGAVSRRALVAAFCSGSWILKHPVITHTEARKAKHLSTAAYTPTDE